MKTVKKILLGAICVLSLGLISCSKNREAAKNGFVVVQNGKFMLNGKEFRFGGTNNYYMHYSPDKMITDELDDAKAMNVSVLRCWGFQYGPNRDHNSHGMDNPGEFGVAEKYIKRNTKKPDEFGYPRDIFERLDYTIAEAGKRNIKLVIAMNNYWDAYGGLQNASTWQRWFKLSSADDFYTDEDCKATYKEFVEHLITRTNTYTGVPYNEDPTIMTWELMNEPRNKSGDTGKIVTEWANEMSAYVKDLAPNQLCSVGDEGCMKLKDFTPYAGEGSTMYNGYEGTDFDSLIGLKNIDYGTFHLYPESWGILGNAQVEWGNEYIRKHAESGLKAKKPVVFEEYGTSASGNLNRLAVYDIWNDTAYKSGIAGTMFWLLTSSNTYEINEHGDGIYDDYDGFRVMNDKSPVSTLLTNYGALFSGSTPEFFNKSRVYLLNPARDQDAKGMFEVRAKYIPSLENAAKVDKAELYVDGEPAPSPRVMNYNVESDTYRLNFDTVGRAKTYPNGAVLEMKVVFTLADGTKMETESNSITIANIVTYSVIKQYDFKDDIANASSMGGYMAEIKEIKHTDLNGGMVEVDGSYSGENLWEELKVNFGTMKEVADAAKLNFTFYYEKSKMIPSATKSDATDKLPGVQPYVAFDPGWVKTGLKEHNAYLKDVPVVTLDDGKEYYKVTTSLEFFQNPGYTFVTICPTLGYIKYDGPIYIDDVILYKKD